MPKIQINAEVLLQEFIRLGPQAIVNYTPPAQSQVIYWTIASALDTQIEFLNQLNIPGRVCQDLTVWELLDGDEFLMAYDVETGKGRLLDERDLEYLGGDGTSLTPAGMRRWWVNRKNDNECLASDSNGLNVWRPE